MYSPLGSFSLTFLQLKPFISRHKYNLSHEHCHRYCHSDPQPLGFYPRAFRRPLYLILTGTGRFVSWRSTAGAFPICIYTSHMMGTWLMMHCSDTPGLEFTLWSIAKQNKPTVQKQNNKTPNKQKKALWKWEQGSAVSYVHNKQSLQAFWVAKQHYRMRGGGAWKLWRKN